MSATTIRDGIVTALEELTGSGQLIKNVYAYGRASSQAYPSAFVMMGAFPAKRRLDGHSDSVTYFFTVRVLIDAENTQEEEDQLLALTDAILTKFMATATVDTLGGLVYKLDITPGSIISANTEMPVRGFEFTIEASVRKLIT